MFLYTSKNDLPSWYKKYVVNDSYIPLRNYKDYAMSNKTANNRVRVSERDDFNRKVGSRFRSIRKAKNYSQEELATWLGITPAAYSTKERGATSFSGHDIQILCRKLKVSPDFIYGWETGNLEAESEIIKQFSEMQRKITDYFSASGALKDFLDIE